MARAFAGPTETNPKPKPDTRNPPQRAFLLRPHSQKGVEDVGSGGQTLRKHAHAMARLRTHFGWATRCTIFSLGLCACVAFLQPFWGAARAGKQSVLGCVTHAHTSCTRPDGV